MILAWPVSPLWQKVYSPYQLLELGHTPQGCMEIRAAGHYYQRVYDLSPSQDALDTEMTAHPQLLRPARTASTARRRDVAVVGAGTGNDVAAALRSGAAAHRRDRDRSGDPRRRPGRSSRAPVRPAAGARRSSTTRARSSAPRDWHVRHDRLRPARLAHAAQPRLERAPRLVRLHGRGVPRGAGAAQGRRASWRCRSRSSPGTWGARST